MNKQTHWLVVLAVIGSLGLVTVQSVAARGWGKGQGEYGCRNYAQAEQLDEKTVADREKFQAENQKTIRQLVTRKAELRALYQQENPDVKRVGELSGEVFDLRNVLHQKADEAGLPGPMLRNTQCDGSGCEGQGFSGPGKRGRGYGRGPMWN
jgi:hypothetical protein